MLFRTWRQLSTPNLASVLDVRQGVLVRGGMDLSKDDPQTTVTCEHGTTVVTYSRTTAMHSSVDPRLGSSSQPNCSLCPGFVFPSSGVLFRGFTAAPDQSVGLESALDPNPPHLASCHEIQPSVSGLESSLGNDLEPNDLQSEGLQSQKVMKSSPGALPQGLVCWDLVLPASHSSHSDLCVWDTSSFRDDQPSSFCRACLNAVASTPTSHIKTPADTGQSLYDELRPFLTDDDTDADPYSSGIMTDDEYWSMIDACFFVAVYLCLGRLPGWDCRKSSAWSEVERYGIWELCRKHTAIYFLKPVTHAQETCIGNWYKLSCSINLNACQSIWYNFSGTSFLHAIEHSSIPSQKLCCTWHEPCNVIGRRVVSVQETVTNLHHIFPASFWYQFLERVSPAHDSYKVKYLTREEKGKGEIQMGKG